MKIILFLAMVVLLTNAEANYSCQKTPDGGLICRPVVVKF